MTACYAELQCTSHFSFLRGASSAEELFAQAAILGIEAMAVADRNSLSGIVRAHEAAKATGTRLIVGCRLDLADGMSLLVYPTDRPAYSRLCRLLSVGKKRGGKAKCVLEWTDVVDWNNGLIAVLIPDKADDLCALRLRKLRDVFADRAYLALTLRRRPNEQLRLHELSNLAHRYRVPTVVTNDVLFHDPSRRILQDVVTCIRHGVTIDEAGFRRERHADRYLKPPEEMARLTAGSEVVEDYRHVGLTLRRHPVSFLRDDLTKRRIVTCVDAMAARDGRWLTAAGLVLVRQKPGSAKGVMFITIEDESGVANLVIWPSLYERQRRIILGASMMTVMGRVQREGEVVHLVANHLTDMSTDLAGVGERDDRFPLPHGRGDEFHHGGSPDVRGLPPKGLRTRDIYIPNLHIDSIKVKTRDFR